MNGAVLDVGTLDDVIEAGEHEIVVNLPLQFAFQDFVHGMRLPPTSVHKTSTGDVEVGKPTLSYSGRLGGR